jgi:hypothetical protein
MEQGLDKTEEAPMDPVWFASYDFEFEAKLAEAIRTGRDPERDPA